MTSSSESCKPSASSAPDKTPDWSPFVLCAPGERPPAPRAIATREGVGDRLRTAAFAERQAREAFAWAARRYTDAPEGLRRAWEGLVEAEDRHLHLILARMEALGVRVKERSVSDALWRSLTACPYAAAFARYMREAEERGRAAEERFAGKMAAVDPASAAMFAEIAKEEASHVALADRFYPLSRFAGEG